MKKIDNKCFFCNQRQPKEARTKIDAVPVDPDIQSSVAWNEIKHIIGMCQTCFHQRRKGKKCDLPPVDVIKQVFYDAGKYQRELLLGERDVDYLSQREWEYERVYGTYSDSFNSIKQRAREALETTSWEVRRYNGKMAFRKGDLLVNALGVIQPEEYIVPPTKTFEEWMEDPRTNRKGNPKTQEPMLDDDDLAAIFELASEKDRETRR